MNVEKLQNYLAEHGYDGILLRRRNHFSWLTCGRDNYIAQNVPEGVADFVIMRDRVYLVTSKMEERRILEEECARLPFPFECLSDHWHNGTDPLIERLGKGKVMAADTPFSDWKVVHHDLVGLRSQLGEEDIVRYRKLCRLSATAVEETCREIAPGQTEHEIAALVAGKVIAQGIRVQVLLVAADERIYRYRHPIPTNKKLEKQAMVVLCAEQGGLVANVTRIVHFGALPGRLKDNKEKLARIDTVMNAGTKPGVAAGDVVRAAVAEYERAGFPEDWKKLHQGGLTGYESREYFATPDSKHRIDTGQAYAWNPSLPGVKSEDTILVTDKGIEFLTHTGHWIYQNVEFEERVYRRPDILVR